MSWINDHSARERCYEAMRQIGEMIETYHRQYRSLLPPPGYVGGAAYFIPWLYMDSGNEFLRCIRSGMTPEQACQAAIDHSRESVRRYNARHEWQIQHWPDVAASWIEGLRRTIERIADA